MNRSSSLLPIAALLTGALASPSWGTELHVSGALPIKGATGVTPPFTSADTNPPINVSLLFAPGLETEKSFFIFRPELSFPPSSVAPAIGVGLGWGRYIDELSFGIEATLRTSSSLGGHFEKSPFSGDSYGVAAWIGYSVPDKADFEFRIRTFGLATRLISDDESLNTRIAQKHTDSYSISGTFSLLSVLRLRAAMDLYSLGAAVIASKEFAFGIPTTQASRLRGAVGLDFDKTQFWIEYAQLSKIADPTERFYQAPFLFEDSLLSSKSVNLEVVWSF